MRIRWLVQLLVALIAVASFSQERKFVTPPAQVVAIRAGKLFDAKSGTLLNNQVVLIRGDRVTDIGSAVQIPREARVIDLSSATVLPGMIDTHVHVNTGGETPAQRALIALANAQIDLAAGFTTVLDMDSRGGWGTVDLRNAINAGLVSRSRLGQGPNIRGLTPARMPEDSAASARRSPVSAPGRGTTPRGREPHSMQAAATRHQQTTTVEPGSA